MTSAAFRDSDPDPPTGGSGPAGVRVPTLWTRPVRGERGPAGELSLGQIAAAATVLADAEGLRAVTMRAVGSALGSSAAGLYRYVRSRDELLALMVDAALADLTYPTPNGDWSGQLLEVARTQLALYRAHPWLVAASLQAGPTGPNALRHFDRCLAILEGVPAAGATKMEALAMLTGVVSLFARPVPEQAADPGVLFAALDPVAHPHLTAVLTAPPGNAAASPEDLFDRVIRGLLTGLLVLHDL